MSKSVDKRLAVQRYADVCRERDEARAECERLRAERMDDAVREGQLRAQLREARELLDRSLGLIEARGPNEPLREDIEGYFARTSKGEAQTPDGGPVCHVPAELHAILGTPTGGPDER